MSAPTHRRLRVEAATLASIVLVGLVHAVLGAAWISLVLSPEQLGLLRADPRLHVLLGAALATATATALLYVVWRLPSQRWPSSRPEAESPVRWLLLLAGAPAILFLPLLWIRDRRARETPSPPRAAAEEHRRIESGFRRLLGLPFEAALATLVCLAVGTGVAVGLLAQHLTLGAHTLTALASLWLLSLLPLATIAAGQLRAMLTPEYLSAPRVDLAALGRRQSLGLRVGGPAAMAITAAIAIPVLVGAAWTEKLLAVELRQAAAAEGQAALARAPAASTAASRSIHSPDPEPEHPRLIDLVAPGSSPGAPRSTLSWGPAALEGLPPAAREQGGFFDLDGDGTTDAWIGHGEGGRHVLVPMEPPGRTPLGLVLTTLLLGLLAGLLSLELVLRDVERDLVRSSRHVAAVAHGEIPEPMALDTFATRELREVVAAMDRLVGRISDANVTKYVLIEKGREADQLKSQFLANMSHDLRSPLNSVLGFSELLSSGIEGRLAANQLEMIDAIHGAGQGLLRQIDNILDTAKIEAGHMELHREPTPPATLIARAIQTARTRLDPQIDIQTEFAAGLPPAFTDPYRTVQAIENILVFAGEGLREGQLHIACVAKRTREGEAAEIVIRVSTPRSLASVEALEQAQRGFVRVPGQSGLGLDLPIATSIIELQGGSVRIQGPGDAEAEAEILETGEARYRPKGQVEMTFQLRIPALTARRNLRIQN